MFKYKSRNQKEKQEMMNRLKLVEKNEYQYVITTDASLVEKDKINIVFSNKDLPIIEDLVYKIKMGENYYINLVNESGIKKTSVRDIEYFESLENEVFAYVGKEKFTVMDKLYVIEKELMDKHFIRTSKSFIVNILKISRIRPMLNYKLELVMMNGDRIDVNRTYMQNFKKALKI
ncbi:MAG: LytTR family DNA-binding domain-containing protein [Bacilli bacterium]|nr:LytTR family DNA-binding domain-containing protein [Bacilli bacterium]